MGRLDVEAMRYMSAEDFRVLHAVELGMRNHELVSTQLTCALASLRSGGAHKLIRRLQNNKLLAYERGKRYDGHRLTVTGYDFLCLHSLVKEDVIDGFGNQIGTGKESDVYAVYGTNGEALALKLHRLGRTSFRKLKLLRNYHGGRSHMSWLYLSTLSARKEFSYMKALHERGFPVPQPVHHNRHGVLMSIVDGEPLCELRELSSPQSLYAECMELMIRLAECGVVHCDFNEFNLLVSQDEHIVLIDFPQMVSTAHPNAEHLFQRDVDCLRRFFARRFHFESDDFPVFSEVVKTEDLDTEIRASGYGDEFEEFDRVCGVQDGEEDDEGLEDESEEDWSETEDRFEDALDYCLQEEVCSEQPDKPRSFPINASERFELRSDSLPSASPVPDYSDHSRPCDGDGGADEHSDSGDEGGLGDAEGDVRQPGYSAEDGSGSEEDEEAAAERRWRMRQLKQQRLQQQREAARSEASAAVARAASARSQSTAASSIAPEVLQRRLRLQSRKQGRRQTNRLRAKGDASAVTRSRRENAQTIRDSTSGFWAD